MPIEVAAIRYRRLGKVWPSTEEKYRSATGKTEARE
jgi:hypothetical protein